MVWFLVTGKRALRHLIRGAYPCHRRIHGDHADSTLTSSTACSRHSGVSPCARKTLVEKLIVVSLVGIPIEIRAELISQTHVTVAQ
jgi:hypothetical protein